MAFIQHTCPKCGKKVTVNSEFTLAKRRFVKYSCGHEDMLLVIEVIGHAVDNIVAVKGQKPYPFQSIGVQFAEKSNLRCLIADEMGLGKTMQATLAVFLHAQDALPAAVVTKATAKAKWQREIFNWTGGDYKIQIIETSQDFIIPGLNWYIFTYDILRRFNGVTRELKHMAGIQVSDVRKEGEDVEIVKKFKELGIRTLILDESQSIKNVASQRAMELRNIVQKTNMPHIIGLSGTPIKNHAAEYFSILNMLRPEYFRTYEGFVRRHVRQISNGRGGWKLGGLAYPAEFHEATKDFIIRRERKDAMPELPQVTRDYRYCDIKEEYETAYKETVKQFQHYYNTTKDKAGVKAGNILGYLSKMRHLTGLMKVELALDFITEFITSSEEKLCVFTHHNDVCDLIVAGLKELCEEAEIDTPLVLTSDLDSQKRDEIAVEFNKNPKKRILIASTLASGEAIDLQGCANSLFVERQWTPAAEEQAEGRFIRIGQLATKVFATYAVALHTIDEFFADIVEQKRAIFKQTIDKQEVNWREADIIQELTEILLQKGMRKWTY